MRILAIRLARFGDVVLLLPALTLLKSLIPGSRITFLTDHRLAPLAEMCPAIDEIIAVDRIAMRDGARLASIASIRQVLREVRHRKFDLAIDFHGFRETNLLTWLSGSSKRIGLKRFGQSILSFCFNLPPVPEDKNIHAAEMFLKIVEQFGSSTLNAAPALVVPEAGRRWVRETLPGRLFAALYVDAPTPKRIWPADRFAAVADYIAGQLGLDVVTLSGPDGAALVNRIRDITNHPDRVCGFSDLTIPQLAAVVEAAKLWISNDTGPMHLGPVLGVPTLGLFSIGLPEHFRPTGIHDAYCLANPIENIRVEEVVAWLGKLGPIDRRYPQR